jgi:hypothetical protein
MNEYPEYPIEYPEYPENHAEYPVQSVTQGGAGGWKARPRMPATGAAQAPAAAVAVRRITHARTRLRAVVMGEHEWRGRVGLPA